MYARGTAVGDRIECAGRREHAVPRWLDSPIGRLLYRGACEQSAMAADARHAPGRRTAEASLLAVALLFSLPLSRSHCRRRLLLSAAWESEARRGRATACPCCSCCWSVFLAGVCRRICREGVRRDLGIWGKAGGGA